MRWDPHVAESVDDAVSPAAVSGTFLAEWRIQRERDVNSTGTARFRRLARCRHRGEQYFVTLRADARNGAEQVGS